MSAPDQCPSTLQADTIADGASPARDVSSATGQAYWRSLDDLAQTSSFRDFVEREFPAMASELLSSDRRGFLKIMGASLALAGVAGMPGCRRPDHKILPYADEPEHIIHGKPLYYATVLQLGNGVVEGVLAETFEGRPTKLEGNPLHPHNLGRISTRAQASILSLYDPDRDPELINKLGRVGRSEVRATMWSQVRDELGERFARFDAVDGEGLVFLVDKTACPTRDRLRDEMQSRWRRMRWLPYDPGDTGAEYEGTRIAYSKPQRVHRNASAVEVMLCIDHDILADESDLIFLRDWSRQRIREGTGRPGHEARDTSMSRLYVAEPAMSVTGGQADHRVSATPQQLIGVAGAIGREVARLVLPHDTDARTWLTDAEGARLPEPEEVEVDPFWIRAVAEDLVANSVHEAGVARVLVTAGPNADPVVHALVAGINALLGADFAPARTAPDESDAGASSVESIGQLASLIEQGEVRTLVCLGTNPAFAAPGDLDMPAKLGSVPELIVVGEADETAAIASRPESTGMYVARSHQLECWGDALNRDGTYSVAQPMIRPLFDTAGELEFLLAAMGEGGADAYAAVRATAREFPGAPPGESRFERWWTQTLHNGRSMTGSESLLPSPSLKHAPIAAAFSRARSRERSDLELVFRADARLASGADANNGWLQELPDPVTKVAWDNPLIMSANTAEQIGCDPARFLRGRVYNMVDSATVTVGGRSVTAPIWISPGTADGVIVATLGNGRRVGGRVATGAGIDCFPLRSSTAMLTDARVAAEPANVSPTMIACTQDHWSMEGRAIIREVDLPAWQKHGDKDYAADKKTGVDAYGNRRDINFAGMFGTEAHTPANKTPYNASQEIYYYEVYRKNGKPVLDKKTGHVVVLREQTVRRDARGRVQFDEDGNALAVENLDDMLSAEDRPVTERGMRERWGRPVGKLNRYGKRVQQWGMTIDLTTCTGCSNCLVACQAENNIPIVGKTEVAKGREMHWIRIDRYYAGEVDKVGRGDANGIEMAVQPVACVHCETAPCEVVCPVNATVHGTEGTNNMSYNRCIGTRYCSNNCPYKVRRFNFFDYATKQFEGSIAGVSLQAEGNATEPTSDHRAVGTPNPGATLTGNENFVPPRFREKVAEVSVLKNNPRVTVRSRGVMEKCTYCIQRVNQARYETKLEDLDFIPDGFFQVACQQACPTGAITFGDIYDNVSNDNRGSRVSQSRLSARSYALLAYLNVRPRTSHLMRIRNPNPALCDADRKARWEHPFHHGEHDSHDDHAGGGDHAMSLPVLNNLVAEGVPA